MIELDQGIIVNISSKDSPGIVAKKTQKAINQYNNPIDGECEDITNKQSLPKLENE